MDTMTWTKIIGAGCGSLLILLLIQWTAEEIYHHSHYKYKEVAYLLEIEEEVTEVEKEEEFITNPQGRRVFVFRITRLRI